MSREDTQTTAQTVAVFALALDIACHRLMQATTPPGDFNTGASELRDALIDEATETASRMSAVMDMVGAVATEGKDDG